ncbi:glycosyl transferase family 1 [Croceivirga lutea]|uniref:glycosyltransferase family 4 protein n=1 Tax=Croceivirga lutea TaxID=1775167 RepID=UPI00163B3259|nr:glycosyltransferase family 4 protein [Croceivirga lutea]GGG55012.1 glycosyl transferase family 1 [Croceivirga lutea]
MVEKEIKTAYISYTNFYDYDNSSYSIGGVQTYLRNLIELFLNQGFKVVFFQLYNYDFDIELDGFVIHGRFFNSKKKESLFSLIEATLKQNDIIVFGSENFSVSATQFNSIVIQHGIYWDLNFKFLNLSKPYRLLPNTISRLLLHRKLIKNFYNARFQVCVDYNYLNWLRTKGCFPKVNVITNFTRNDETINPEFINQKHNSAVVKILFARRFVEMRGVKLFLELIKILDNRYPNVEFTFAGEGDLYSEIEKLKFSHKITITKFDQTESLEFTKQFHISVIPSLGSEGTSISALEAMAVGTSVVASNVGGLTNIIVDSYNGLLCQPSKNSFLKSVSLLIENRNLRINLSQNALRLAKTVYSKNLWQKKWIELINQIQNES